MEQDTSMKRSCAKTGADGKVKRTAWITCKGKNIGKSNESTPETQAGLEVGANYAKKLKDHWWSNEADWQKKDYIEPMLARKYGDTVIEAPIYGQHKLDGIRCILTKDGAFSRKGEPFVSIPHIVKGSKAFFKDYPDAIFDGELYNHEYKDRFEDLTSIIRRQTLTPHQFAISKGLIQYHIYDLISLPEQPFSSRDKELRRYIYNGSLDTDIFKKVPSSYLSSIDKVDACLEESLAEGYEGLMVRLDTPYEIGKRSKSLLKYKKFDTAEFTILDIQEGKGNWAGYAKRLIIQLEDNTPCEAGIKGDFEFTKKLLEDKALYIGKEATLRFFGRTSDNKLRFGVAIDFHQGKRTD